MLLKYFEKNLIHVSDLEGVHKSFQMIKDLKGYTEKEKYFELNGEIIKKAYELGYTKECYFFIKDMDLNNIKNLKLKSCLVYILLKTSISTKNTTHKYANNIAHNFDPNLYHVEYRNPLALYSALLLKKNGFIYKSISLLKKYNYLKCDPLALLQLSLNYHFLKDFEKEIKIYEKLEKEEEEEWIYDIIFFRKAKIFLKTKNKNKLTKLINNIDTYQLLKPIESRYIRCLEFYKIHSFLGNICKANFFFNEAEKIKSYK